MGRPTKYDPSYCDAVIAHMSEGASLTSFAASIDVCRATINVWMEEHPEFLEAARIAKAKCAAWWETTSRVNAKDGGGNSSLCIFGLKNMGADDWRDKTETEQSGTVTNVHKIERTFVRPSAD